MKAVAVTLLVTAAVALASNNNGYQTTLTLIDAVPTKQQLDQAFMDEGLQPLQTLTGIATDPDPTADGGIRLRAIHALAKYCPAVPCVAADPAHQAVVTVLQQTRDVASGTDVLFLRAAIETLGVMKVSTDETSLVDLLNHPSRDIRAATARALRDLCNPQAVLPLRARYSSETTDQVKLAISEALRILGQCQPN